MSYLTASNYDRYSTLPIILPQTELRRESYLQVAIFNLELGQRLEMSCCYLHLFRVLTPSVTALLSDSSLGLVCAGLLTSTMFSSAVGLVTLHAVGTSGWNQDQPVIITAPGTYRAVVLNNSSNVDLSVVLTGNVRIYF